MKFILFLFFALVSKVHSQVICDPSDPNPSWHPHPFDCTKYFICFWGNLVERQCAPGLYYNRVTTQCMIPELANCVLDYTPDCEYPDDPDNLIFFPHIEDCTRYFLCFNGSAIRRQCADGLFWDINDEWCNFPNLVTCDSNTSNNPNPQTTTIRPTTTTTTEATTTRNPDIFDCPQTPGVSRFPHSISCDRYFLCINGKLESSRKKLI